MKATLNILLLLLFTLASNFTFSQDDSDVSKTLEGTWYTNKRKSFIQFEGNRFSHTIKSKDTIKGAWSFDKKLSILTLRQDVNLHSKIDSTVLESNPDGSQLKYYSNGIIVATEKDDSLTQSVAVQLVEVKFS